MNTDGLLWHYDINMIHKILRYLCIYASMHHYPILYWFIRYSLSDGIILSACWSIRLVAPLGHTEGDSPQKKLNLLVNFGIYPLEKHSHRTWPIYRWFIMIYLSISLISWWFSGIGSPDINHCPDIDRPSPLGHVEVATHASTLVRADRCSVFLVDERTDSPAVVPQVWNILTHSHVKRSQMALVEFSNLE